MNISFRIIVMSTMPYAITDENTGEVKEGITAEYYYFPDDNALVGKPFDHQQLTGFRRSKASLDVTQGTHFYHVPGVYNGFFEMVNDKDGKTKLALRTIEPLGDIEFKATILNEEDSKKDSKKGA